MQQNFPFQPSSGVNTTVIPVTAASVTTNLASVLGYDGGTLRIVNSGTQTVFIVFGAGTALVSSMPMLANSVETFGVSGVTTSITAIAAATGSTLYVTVGIGA